MKRIFISLLLLAACSESTGSNPDHDGGVGGSAVGGNGGGSPGKGGAAVAVEVTAGKRSFLSLAKPEVVTPADNGSASTDWDLAFEALDVYTNSGPSGPGEGGAFGPHDASAFSADVAPETPFISTDETGGAFVNWFAYDGATHKLWNRYHVYGVRAQGRTWKVQILGYYGEVQGAPVSALYSLRYAEIVNGSAGPTTLLSGVDGTAGGSSAPEDVPSECLDLASGERHLMTPDEARQSTDWHLCFRRAAISVNGELGGPGDTAAVDLDDAGTAKEKLDQLMAKTAATEEAHFTAVGAAETSSPKLVYRGDRVVSAFSDHWLAEGKSLPAPAPATWVVQSADGVSRFLVSFESFDGATSTVPGTVNLRVKAVK